MTQRIKFSPSNHEFSLEGNDTLLEAALRSGYSPNYGCNSGNCGKCLVKLINGDIEKVKNHDYVMNIKQKNNQEFLLCAHTAKSDLVLQVSEANTAKDIPIQNIKTKLKSVKAADENVSLISIQTPRSKTLRFLAGQFIELSCESMEAGKFYIASCPCDDRNLQLHIRRDKTIKGKNITECLSGMQQVNIRGPFGEFNLEEDPPHPAVFICQEHGFAPIKSLIEHAIALDYQASISLSRFSHSNELQYLHNLCRSWADALDDFQYEASNSSELSQKIVEIIASANKLEKPVFYLSGTQEFVFTAETALKNTNSNWDIRTALIE